MKRSGLKMVFCGAESGSTDTLKRMNKGGTAAAELTLELARRMKAYGIVPEFSFVVGNPPDPEGDLAANAGVHRRVKAINPAAEIILYVYSPVPRHDVYERRDEWLCVSRNAGRVGERALAERSALRRDPRTPWSPRDDSSARAQLRDRAQRLLPDGHGHAADAARAAACCARRRPGAITRAVERGRSSSNLLQRVFHYQRPETTGF